MKSWNRKSVSRFEENISGCKTLKLSPMFYQEKLIILTKDRYELKLGVGFIEKNIFFISTQD
jgi:hypothetical protein